MENSQPKRFHFKADTKNTPCRLDLLITLHLPEISRSATAQLIRNGHITVDGQRTVKPAFIVKKGQSIDGSIPLPEPIEARPEAIDINVLYVDKQIIVVNKSAGMVVHPAPGNYTGTLVNALLHHFPDQLEVGGHIRPGIVHRLDKETSGCLVIAQTDLAHQSLMSQFKSRQVTKKYVAVVVGNPAKEHGRIDLPIGRHPVHRKQMAVNTRNSRRAETYWQVTERYGQYTLLALDLKTGRTHQIRVHCTAMNHPILGDPIYGEKRAQKPILLRNNRRVPVLRQMLHAWELGISHPKSGAKMIFTAPMPNDMEQLTALLKKERTEA